jgi:hypothetical protein
MRAAKIADQKSWTSSVSLHRAVNMIIPALTMKINKPSVRITAGKVKNLIIEPIVTLIVAKIKATQK